MIDAATLQWAAGFLEGEGCWPRANQIQVCAAQVQRWPLERLKLLFGGSICNHHVMNPRASRCWSWKLYGSNAAALSMTLYSLMSPKRQEQISRALVTWIPKPLDPAMRAACPKGHQYTSRTPTVTNRARRHCLICERDRARRRYHRLRNAA